MEFNGLYNVVAKAPMLGRQRGKFNFTNEGGSISCVVTFMRNDVPVEGLTIDGNSFSGICNAPSPMGTMRLDVSGTVEGTSISGVMKTAMGDMVYSGELAE